jgi:hypothetical protein
MLTAAVLALLASLSAWRMIDPDKLVPDKIDPDLERRASP